MLNRDCACTLALVLLFFAVNGRVIATNFTTNQCVPAFRTNPEWFEECKTRLCFTFLDEAPFVITPENLTNSQPRPFSCRLRNRLYPGLGGFFFNMLDKLSTMDVDVAEDIRNALCIYGGPKCTFNDEVRFVAHNSWVNSNYRLIAGGYLLFIEDRMVPRVIPSVHHYVETLSLMYRKGTYSGSFQEAFDRILGPFELSGWAIVIMFAVLHFLCLAFFIWRYRPNSDATDVMNWLVNPQELAGFYQRMGWLFIPVSVTCYATVLVLLYEISVASFIFEGVLRL